MFLKRLARLLSVVLAVVGWIDLYPQIDATEYSISFEEIDIPTALQYLGEKTSTSIVFSPDFFPSPSKIHQTFQEATLEEILEELLRQFDVEFRFEEGLYIITRKKDQMYHLHGYIVSQENGEPLPYAYVVLKNDNKIFVSDGEGYYNLSLAEGRHELEISYLGHEVLQKSIELSKSRIENITLPSSNVLPEIIIDEFSLINEELGQHDFSHKNIMELSRLTPGIGGSNDLLQTAKMIPGIQSGGGGIGGYFIRGGNNDQNLFLLDGISIYNPFHSLGMASIFTPHSTKNLKIVTSGFQSKYGDRSSAVFDVRIKDGNKKKYEIASGINPQDGFLKIEGPIKPLNGSFFIYGRTTTSAYKFNNIINRSLFTEMDAESSTYYSDWIAKLSVELNPRNKLYATFFKSLDKIEGTIEEENRSLEEYNEINLDWGNQVSALRWQSILNPKSFLNVSVSANSYSSDFGFLYQLLANEEEVEDFYFNDVASKNRDLESNIDLDIFQDSNLRFNVGVGFQNKQFRPTVSTIDEDSEEFEEYGISNFDFYESLSSDVTFHTNKIYQYVETTFDFKKWTVQSGIRNTHFSFQEFNAYHLQPRLKIDFQTSERLKFSGSMAKLVQYVHLLSNSEVNLPRDVWYPSNDDFPPEETWHFNFSSLIGIESYAHLSIEAYYKSTQNKSVAFGFDATPVNPNEIPVAIGSTRNLGLEFNLQIDRPKWTSNWALSLAQSRYHIPSINLGIPYNFQFDRLIEFKSSHVFRFSKNWSAGLSTYISSGHPLFVAYNLDADLGLQPIDINTPGTKNSIRTSWQHRLDISLNHWRVTGKLKHEFKLNVYNAYNNDLPLFYTRGSLPSTFDSQFSIPLIPSLAYTISF